MMEAQGPATVPMTDLEWLRQIGAADAAATAHSRTVVETPAFRLLLDPHDDFGGVNWATPLKPDPSRAEVETMLEAFRAHHRTPRLEFLAECWPGVAAALKQAGFRPEGDPQDVMIVTPETFRAVSAGEVTLQFLAVEDPDEVFASYLLTQGVGFGYAAGAPTTEQISAWREQLRVGRRAVLGSLAGRAAGVGTTLGAGLSELQGVATLPEVRRQGVAAALSSALVQGVFAQGGKAVWLSVEDTAARACYEKIGFRPIGTRLNSSV